MIGAGVIIIVSLVNRFWNGCVLFSTSQRTESSFSFCMRILSPRESNAAAKTAFSTGLTGSWESTRKRPPPESMMRISFFVDWEIENRMAQGLDCARCVKCAEESEIIYKIYGVCGCIERMDVFRENCRCSAFGVEESIFFVDLYPFSLCPT